MLPAVLIIAAPFALAAYFLVRNRRPYPPRGRKLGGEYTNYEPPVELNISGRAFPEDPTDTDDNSQGS
jgi:hypothetical protein